jgi:hypothetical protein
MYLVYSVITSRPTSLLVNSIYDYWVVLRRTYNCRGFVDFTLSGNENGDVKMTA